jgi:hypothetical protein
MPSAAGWKITGKMRQDAARELHRGRHVNYEIQVLDPETRAWIANGWTTKDSITEAHLTVRDHIGRVLPVRIVDIETRETVLENDRARMLREAQETLTRKNQTRKENDADKYERASISRAEKFVVTILDGAMSPDMRRCEEFATIEEAAKLYRTAKRALMYAVLPSFRQTFVRVEFLEERGL